MTKRIALILAILILLPAVASAAWPEGTAWVHSELTKERAPYMEYLYLAEDGVCYYMTFMHYPDREALGRTYTGTWETTAGGGVHAKTGEHTELKLIFSNDQEKAMDEDNPTSFFYYVYTFDLN